MMILDVSSALKQVKMHESNRKLESAINAVKILEEKLSVESDFGYGNDNVINCENNIAKQLQFLLDCTQNIKSGNLEENIQKINTSVSNISSLLRRRTELKKR